MANGPAFEAKPGWSKWVKENLIYIIPAAAVIVLIIVLAVSGGDGNPAITSSPSGVPTTSSLPVGTLEQKVQTRDSYTSVSRRAITAFAATTEVNETPGQRLYTETVLQTKIRNQSLMTGATVSFSSAQIKEILDAYNRLTSGQRTKWEAMARNVKF